MVSRNFSLKMIDVNSISVNASRSSLNETEGMLNRYKLNVPDYLYREIPAVFEIIGTILNIAIIVYFIKSRKYRSPTFTILTSSATMDTCVCLGAAMSFLIVPKVIIPQGGFICVLALFMPLTGVIGSEYTLIFCAGVKLYQVMLPLKARASITMSLMVRYWGTIITVSISLSLLHAVFWRQVTMFVDRENITVCTFIGDDYAKDLSLMIGLTIIPCSTIFLIHLLKYFAYVRSNRLLSTKQERKSPDAHAVAIVIFLFYISITPSMTYTIIQHFRRDDYAFLQDNLFLVLMHVSYANSIMNPLVYVLAMKAIRDDVIKIFCFAKHKSSN